MKSIPIHPVLARMLAALLMFLAALPGVSPAQEPPPADDVDAEGITSSLAARQKRIKRLMVELEAAFTELSARLQEENPDQAEKLAEAYKKSRTLLFQTRMDEITSLLNDGRLENASREQVRLIADLQALLEYLLTEDELARLRKMIDELEGYQKVIDELVAQETGLKNESDLSADPRTALDQLDEWIARARGLVEEQEAAAVATERAPSEGIDAFDAVAATQSKIRGETQALAREIAEQQGERRPGVRPLEAAAEDQDSALSALRRTQAPPALAAEQAALEDLRAAVAELEEERARVAAMGPQTNEALAGQQNSTSQQAGQLAQQMSQSPQAATPQVASAAGNVSQARQSMNQATQNLENQAPAEASPNQQEAIDQLRGADDSLQERVDELRDQAVDAQLNALEKLFRHMLDRQKQISAETRDVDARRVAAAGDLARADRIAVARLTTDEQGLADNAAEAESLLTDDGTSIVFQSVVAGLRRQIEDAVALMRERRTGSLVQDSHVEIERTIEELLEALKSARENNDPNDTPPNQNENRNNNRQQRLVSKLAELKLLRLHQLRINRRTENLGREVRANGEDPLVEEQIEGLSGQQEELEEMARKMAQTEIPAAPQPPDPAGVAPSLVGEPAPDFSLALFAGGKFQLQDAVADSVVVLDFWATWCGPCIAAMPELMVATAGFEKGKVRLIGVNQREEVGTIDEFLGKQQWDLEVALDTDGKVGRQYGVTGIPQTVVIGRDGVVRNVHVGFREDIAEVIRAEIEAALKEE